MDGENENVIIATIDLELLICGAIIALVVLAVGVLT